MGSKIKKHQERKPRNYLVKQLIIEDKGSPMRDRRERRLKEHQEDWRNEK
jgi:hypothetical protein